MKTFRLIFAVMATVLSFIACEKPQDSGTDKTPILKYLTPEKGGAGDEVKIVGDNFSLKTNENTVKFGEAESEIIFAYVDTLIVRVPSNAGETVSVMVNGVQADQTLKFGYEASWVLKSLSAMESGIESGPSSLDKAKFRYAMNLCSDENGNLYVAERCTHTIKKISPTGNTVEIFAGKYIGDDEWGEKTHYKDGSQSEAEFNSPMDIVYAGNNTFYVADFMNNAVRKIQDGKVSTIGKRRVSDDDWENVQMYENTDFKMSLDDFKFSRPQGLLYDSENNDLYVSSQSHYIVRVDIDANEVELFAGSPFNPGNNDGERQKGKMNCPRGMAFDTEGNLYVANEYGQCISKVDKNHNLTVYAGLAGSSGAVDGIGVEAKFNGPQYIILQNGALLVSDFFNHAIRKVSLDNAQVTTWAGIMEYNDVKDGGLSECKLSYPIGLAYSYDRKQIYMTQAETYEGIRVFQYE